MSEENGGGVRGADRLRRVSNDGAPDTANGPTSGLPGDPDALLREAFARFNENRLDDVRALCAQVLKSAPDHFDAVQLMAIACFQTGARDQALEYFRAGTRLRPDNARAHYFLGTALSEVGRFDEAAAGLKRAIEIAPDYAEALTNLGTIAQQQGDFDAAIGYYEKSLALNPASATANSNLAIALQQQGRLDEAIACYRRAIELDDSVAFLHFNMGVALEGMEDWSAAADSYRRAIELAPRYAEAIANLGVIRHESGARAEAIELYRRAIEANPKEPQLYYKLALALRDEGRLDEAEQTLRESIERTRALPQTCVELGIVLMEKGDIETANETILALVRQLRAPAAAPPQPVDTFDIVNRPKIRHDIDQLAYLAARNLLDPAEAKALIADYEDVAERLPDPMGSRLSELNPPPAQRLATAYNRLLYLDPAPALPGGALNPDLDTAGIEADFAADDPGFACFDDFLRPEAREALWRYCLESTVWFDVHYVGDVGAGIENGFCCPLLLQIASEIRTAFPNIFGAHPFTSYWAYKYLEDVSGLGIHADEGAVSINFWITPDAANNDPETGGLKFWNKQAPYSIYSRPPETKIEIAERAVAEPDARATYVPYRCNRAMIFQSNVFHDTAPIDFKDGYENKRINMTFVYGRPMMK